MFGMNATDICQKLLSLNSACARLAIFVRIISAERYIQSLAQQGNWKIRAQLVNQGKNHAWSPLNTAMAFFKI
jgi:hypothetical protein